MALIFRCAGFISSRADSKVHSRGWFEAEEVSVESEDAACEMLDRMASRKKSECGME